VLIELAPAFFCLAAPTAEGAPKQVRQPIHVGRRLVNGAAAPQDLGWRSANFAAVPQDRPIRPAEDANCWAGPAIVNEAVVKSAAGARPQHTQALAPIFDLRGAVKIHDCGPGRAQLTTKTPVRQPHHGPNRTWWIEANRPSASAAAGATVWTLGDPGRHGLQIDIKRQLICFVVRRAL